MLFSAVINYIRKGLPILLISGEIVLSSATPAQGIRQVSNKPSPSFYGGLNNVTANAAQLSAPTIHPGTDITARKDLGRGTNSIRSSDPDTTETQVHSPASHMPDNNQILRRYLSQTGAVQDQEQDVDSPYTPIKCLTPVIKQYERNRGQFSPETQQYMQAVIRESQSLSGSPDSLLSPSGKFELHYTTTGVDSVPATDENLNGTPDYVERAAGYADSTWRHEIRNLGYPDPLTRQETPYNIYLRDTDTGIYGSTFEQNDGSGTYFAVHRNFNDFPPNTDPEGDRLGALKVTIAHEFKHAINYFITNWQGEVDQWAEMDATLMEDLVFDPVNDYYNYIRFPYSIFRNPGYSLYTGSYAHVSFALYFTDTFEAPFWTRVWEYIDEGYENAGNPTMLGSIDSTLQEYSEENLDHHFARNHLWHFASGSSRVAQNYGFADRFDRFQGELAYPPSKLTYNHDSTGVPDSLSGWRTLENLSAHHLNIVPQTDDHGPVQVSVQYDSTRIGVGLIAYRDGNVQTHIQTSRNRDSLLITPNWWWGRIDRLGVVVTNPDPNHFGLPYRIRYGTLDRPIVGPDLPEQNTLQPNYPNPFNQSTRLSFFLTHTQDVTVRVYDVTGRRVRTLRRNSMLPGPQTLPFRAGNLSSGLYIYRVITETHVMTGKMMLLK